MLNFANVVVDPVDPAKAVTVVDRDDGDIVRAVVVGEPWPYPYDMVDAESVVRAVPNAAVPDAAVPDAAVPVAAVPVEADPVEAVAVTAVPAVEPKPVAEPAPCATSDPVVKTNPVVDV